MIALFVLVAALASAGATATTPTTTTTTTTTANDSKRVTLFNNGESSKGVMTSVVRADFAHGRTTPSKAEPMAMTVTMI